MYAEERQRTILSRARANGRVDVSSLAESLNVTAETVRRDLTTLDRCGVIRRVHGGAVPIERVGSERAVAVRDTVLTEEKERIAKLAVAEIPNDGAIVLDAGTTTAQLAHLLPTDRDLTVVVNSPVLATILSTKPNVTVLMLGGRMRRKTMATVDMWALHNLSEIHLDMAFMGTNGITAENGLTTPHQSEATIKRAMIDASRRTVLLADHTKVGHDHMAQFAKLSDVGLMICDSGLDNDLAVELETAGVKLRQA